MLVNKDVHQIWTHVGSDFEELEEPTIVALDKGRSHLEGMLHLLGGFFLCSEVLQQTERLCFHLTEDVIQDFIGQELLY